MLHVLQRVRGKLGRSQGHWNPSQRQSTNPVAMGGPERMLGPWLFGTELANRGK